MSYVNFVNGDTKSTEAYEPALLLDESCLNQLDYSLGATSWFSQIIQASKEFVINERITWVDIEGIPLKLWSESAFNRIAAKWGKMFIRINLQLTCE
nr:nucleotide-binding alpha-beta plait domain-containing protein [Tanacetum cinerariifolium]